jgi:hypothetical protein
VKYVVVKPFGDMSKISIVEEGTELTRPFESWALRDGKQILFATTKMHKVLQSQHFAGSYDKGAMYAYNYMEMCKVISAHLGPCDRERYEASLKEQSQPVLIEGNAPADYLGRWPRIAYILWKTFVLIIKVAIKSLNVLLFLVILPFIIKLIEGFRK